MLARMVRHVDVVIDQKCSSRLRFALLNSWKTPLLWTNMSNCRKSRDYQGTNRVFVRTMEFETRRIVCYVITWRQKRLPGLRKFRQRMKGHVYSQFKFKWNEIKVKRRQKRLSLSRLSTKMLYLNLNFAYCSFFISKAFEEVLSLKPLSSLWTCVFAFRQRVLVMELSKGT